MDNQDFPLKMPANSDLAMPMPEPSFIILLYNKPLSGDKKARFQSFFPIKPAPTLDDLLKANALEKNLKAGKLVPLPPTKADQN